MTAELDIRSERVDDIPLLLEQLHQMQMAEIIDRHIQPHGNHQGLSIGWLVVIWLCFIISAADHRLNQVEEWVRQRWQTLSALVPHPVRVKDFTDDRLADVLRYLSMDSLWDEIEVDLGRHLVSVYELHQQPVRLDSTSVAVYHDEQEQTLFRKGVSKDHRPDLAQFKLMLGCIDPLGLPLATLVVPGNEADDGLYRPLISSSRAVLGQGKHLYVGDCKMGSLANRAWVEAGGDYYLMPLAQTGQVPQLLEQMLNQVWQGQQRLERVYPDPEQQKGPGWVAAVTELERQQEAKIEGRELKWSERVLLVHSPAWRRQGYESLQSRLEKAEEALKHLSPKRGRQREWSSGAEVDAAIGAILKQYRVQGLLQVDYELEQRQPRPGKSSEESQQPIYRCHLQIYRNQVAVRQMSRRLGWRLYATNAPSQALAVSKAVEIYRGAPRMERNFLRLKGKPLGIRPLYVQRDDHAKGLVRLLSLGLRLLSGVEFQVRQQLQAGGEKLKGLYAGNPQRESEKPTTELILRVFQGITLTVMVWSGGMRRHLTPLTALQRRILELLEFPLSIYEHLVVQPMVQLEVQPEPGVPP